MSSPAVIRHVFSLCLAILIGCASPLVHVRVVDAETGRPIDGVEAQHHGVVTSIVFSGPGSHRTLGRTDSFGKIEISNLSPSYERNDVDFFSPGYAVGSFVWLHGDYFGWERTVQLESPNEDFIYPEGNPDVSGVRRETQDISQTITVRLFRNHR